MAAVMPKRSLFWFKFEPRAWRADLELRSCTLAARGLWIEMLALMHESNRRGYLEVSGKAPSPEQLAMLVGCLPKEVSRLLQELEDAGVLSREPSGTIYSPRMVREHLETTASRKRVARHRKSSACNGSCNGDCNGTCNAPRNGDVTAQSKSR